MHWLFIGKDCWLIITRFIEDFKDWNHLRSSCRYFKKLCSFEEAKKRWAKLLEYEYFSEANSFIEWKNQLRFYHNLSNFTAEEKLFLGFKGHDLVRDLNTCLTFNQKRLQFTTNECVYHDAYNIFIYDKKESYLLLNLRFRKYTTFVSCTKDHIFIWKYDDEEVCVYNSDILRHKLPCEKVYLNYDISRSTGFRGACCSMFNSYSSPKCLVLESKNEYEFIIRNNVEPYLYRDNQVFVTNPEKKKIVFKFANGNVFSIVKKAYFTDVFRFLDYLIVVASEFAGTYQIIRLKIKDNNLIEKTYVLEKEDRFVRVQMLYHFLFILETSTNRLIQLDVLSGRNKRLDLDEHYSDLFIIGTCVVLYNSDGCKIIDFK